MGASHSLKSSTSFERADPTGKSASVAETKKKDTDNTKEQVAVQLSPTDEERRKRAELLASAAEK